MTDYTKICRVCLRHETEKTGHLLPINKTRVHVSTISLLEAMRLFVNVELTNDERFPQCVCASCVKDITAGYVFKLKCETAEKFLNKEILNCEPPAKAKKDACTSTTDLAYEEDYECEGPTKEKQSKKQNKTQHYNQVPCKVENDMIEIVNERIDDNVDCDPIRNNDGEMYNQFGQNSFEVIKDPISGQNVFSLNLAPYSLINPYEPKYSEWIGSANNPLGFDNGYYGSKIEIEDNPVENIEHIIEKAEYVMESEMPFAEDKPNETDEEIVNAVSSISNSIPVQKRRRRRGPKRKRKQTAPIVSKTLDCIACAEKHDNLDSLKKHFLVNHIHGQFCTVCNREYDRNGSMQRHVNAHFRVEKVRCEVCLKEFNGENALVVHRAKYHVVYDCPQCHQTFESHGEYVSHLPLHDKQPEESLASNRSDYELKQLCEYCNKLFDGLLGLKSHFQLVHTENNVCKVCNITTTSTSMLRSHIHEHFRRPIFRCVECRKRFAKEISFKIHNVEMHNGYDICKYCLMEFSSKEEFDEHHLEHEMTGTIGCFKCRTCGVTTSSSTSLMSHLVAHEQSIECTGCYHIFRKEADYKKHLVLGHKMKCEPKCKLCRFKVVQTEAENQ